MRSALFILIFSLLIISNGKAQILKDKKNVYKDVYCYIERVNAKNFNYEDDSIKFSIRPNFTWWTIRIENKTKQNMTIFWDKALFVFNQQSGAFMIVTDNLRYLPIPFLDEIIAPYSYIENDYTSLTLRGRHILDNRMIKKTGLDYYIELILPIEINGELKTYNLKYKISLINQKKQKKALEKTMKKMFKEAQKEAEQS